MNIQNSPKKLKLSEMSIRISMVLEAFKIHKIALQGLLQNLKLSFVAIAELRIAFHLTLVRNVD